MWLFLGNDRKIQTCMRSSQSNFTKVSLDGSILKIKKKLSSPKPLYSHAVNIFIILRIRVGKTIWMCENRPHPWVHTLCNFKNRNQIFFNRFLLKLPTIAQTFIDTRTAAVFSHRVTWLYSQSPNYGSSLLTIQTTSSLPSSNELSKSYIWL